MITDIIKYVDFFFEKTKKQHSHLEDSIIKAALVYQYLDIEYIDDYKIIYEIIEETDGTMRLAGPGNGCLTWVLHPLFAGSDTLQTHAILHDAFGWFYLKYKRGPGYTYTMPMKLTTKRMKGDHYLVNYPELCIALLIE